MCLYVQTHVIVSETLFVSGYFALPLSFVTLRRICVVAEHLPSEA